MKDIDEIDFNEAMHKILRSDIDWAYGIMLALRECREIPPALDMQVDTFIDHYHKVYS